MEYQYRVKPVPFYSITMTVFNRFLGRNETIVKRTYQDTFTYGREVMGNYEPTVALDPSDPYRV